MPETLDEQKACRRMVRPRRIAGKQEGAEVRGWERGTLTEGKPEKSEELHKEMAKGWQDQERGKVKGGGGGGLSDAEASVEEGAASGCTRESVGGRA